MISLFQQTLFFMISKYMLKKWVLNSNPWGNRKGWFSYFLSFAMIKSPWWRCSVCWKSVLDLFWQMFALSAWASYLKWQTVWCHLSNKNLWEFSFCSSFSSTSSIFSLPVLYSYSCSYSYSYSYSFSSTSSIFSLPVSYSAKSGRQQRPPQSACNALTGDSKLVFAPPGWVGLPRNLCLDATMWQFAKGKIEIQGRLYRNPRETRYNPRKAKCGGFGGKTVPGDLIVAASGVTMCQYRAIHSLPLSDKLWYARSLVFLLVADNQICCRRWNHISRGDTPYHISPLHRTIFLCCRVQYFSSTLRSKSFPTGTLLRLTTQHSAHSWETDIRWWWQSLQLRCQCRQDTWTTITILSGWKSRGDWNIPEDVKKDPTLSKMISRGK